MLFSRRVLVAAAFFAWCVVERMDGSTISLGGLITQSTPDGTGPAVNNPGLNNIQDGQAYTVTLNFAADITAPGTYTPSSLVFSVPAAGATETAFGLLSMTITANASFDDFSLLGCLTTGSDCASGNQLTATFRIPAASLTSLNVAATGLDPPHPLDLLEDDGITDIHGSITLFSNANAAQVPEPGPAAPVGLALIVLGAFGRSLRREHGK